MVCKHCHYQNHSEAKYCSGCGRKLIHEGGVSKKALVLAAVCFLIAGIGIGMLLPRIGTTGENVSVEGEERAGFLPKKGTVEIRQVLPMDDGAVAVLYTDGTVRVSGNDEFSTAVSDWNDIAKLFYDMRYSWGSGEIYDISSLVGLKKDGSVLTTDGKLSGWSDVKDLYFHWQGVVGVTHGGRVLINGDWEDVSFFERLTDVEALANVGEEWGCLKKDGSVVFNYDMSGYGINWKNVKELRTSDHGFYAIMKDNTVEGMFDDTYTGLDGAVKVVDFEDWLFGISADGRLLTHNGGNISPNLGDLTVVAAEEEYYFPEVVDIHQFDQLKDIVPFCGLILLNKDGTAEHIGSEPDWDLSVWHDVQKACGKYSMDEGPFLYGIRKDGSVIMHTYDGYQENYRNWKLKDLYTGSEGVVGLTTDGKLVGDGIYESVDFSVFER